MKKIFAVVVTHNGLQWYHKCFSSLLESKIQLNIIAVDNGSKDGSVEYIQENFPEIQVLEQNNNLGFGQANNIGIKKALSLNADYVFLLNQDARIEANTIEILLNIHQANQEFGILSPLHLNGPGDQLDGGFLNYASPQYTPKLLSDLSLNKMASVYDSKFVNAAAWLMSSKCLKEVGGFDPLFFHYGEDYNYCQRVRYHGMKIGIVPGTKIYHDRNYSREEYGSEQILRHYLLIVADINNTDFRLSHKNLKQHDMIRMATSLFRFNWGRFLSNWNNLNMKRKLYPRIIESRKTNKEGGAVYIT